MRSCIEALVTILSTIDDQSIFSKNIYECSEEFIILTVIYAPLSHTFTNRITEMFWEVSLTDFFTTFGIVKPIISA